MIRYRWQTAALAGFILILTHHHAAPINSEPSPADRCEHEWAETGIHNAGLHFAFRDHCLAIEQGNEP